MITFDEAHKVVVDLCNNFSAYKAKYLGVDYSESQARTDFINKLLIALGWDVNHELQQNPYEQEVKVEKNVNVGASQKRADYALFVQPNFRDVRVYVEAKKPLVSIANEDNYFQTIRYGWNSSTPLAVLTDFNSIHVLDCRYRPKIGECLNRVVFKLNFEELLDKESFARIYWLLSREAVHSGAIEKFAEGLAAKGGKEYQPGLFKGGYQKIDDAFLEDLEQMREMLARSFKAKNPKLDGETLTEITQRVLDRLVFLRFLEDKLVELQEKVSKFGGRGDAWAEFLAACRRLDSKYNGTVFKKHTLIDDVTKLKADNAVFQDICDQFNDTSSPYDFNVIPIHILGSIYERFLGKIITVTKKGARLEEKKEVRKAGGVYYTPEIIVRMIVDKTVGRLIEGKSPDQILALKFADISCGSGSFLLGVYDSLLRHVTNWYNKQSSSKQASYIKSKICERGEDGFLHLTLAKRREVLLSSIFGVDIDSQAVDVAHLSLYLKLLEEVTTATAQNYQIEMGVALLPSLSKNIVCGNSLVGSDIGESGDLFIPTNAEDRKTNPMDFGTRFTFATKDGLFDAVVGNPPYGAAIQKAERKYLELKYPSVADRETSQYFLDRSHQVVKPGGYVSYIVPNTLVLNIYAKRFRTTLLGKFKLIELFDLSDVDVFEGATVRTVIPVLRKPLERENTGVDEFVEFTTISKEFAPVRQKKVKLSDLRVNDDEWRSGAVVGDRGLIDKVLPRTTALGKILDISQGLIPYDKYRGHTPQQIKNRVWHSDHKKDKSYKRELRGGDVSQYFVKWNGALWISYGPWLAAPRRPDYFKKPRLLFREITDARTGIHVAYTEDEFYNTPSIINCIGKDTDYSLFFLLAVCNSRFVAYRHFLTSPKAKKGVFPKILVNDVRNIAIPTIDFTDKKQKKMHDDIDKFARRMLEAKKLQMESETDRDRDYYANRFADEHAKAEALINTLYGLSVEDVESMRN